jgi:hypothetical protein
VTRRPFPPEHRAGVLAQVTADITAPRNLNPRRRWRSYPRVVKRVRHNFYRAKQPTDTGVRHDGPPTVTLASVTRSGTLINTS